MDIIKKFEGLSCETYVYDDCEGDKFLECVIDGTPYRFNVTQVPEDKLKWLATVYSSNLKQLYENTRRNQAKEIRNKRDELLGMIGIK